MKGHMNRKEQEKLNKMVADTNLRYAQALVIAVKEQDEKYQELSTRAYDIYIAIERGMKY